MKFKEWWANRNHRHYSCLVLYWFAFVGYCFYMYYDCLKTAPVGMLPLLLWANVALMRANVKYVKEYKVHMEYAGAYDYLSRRKTNVPIVDFWNKAFAHWVLTAATSFVIFFGLLFYLSIKGARAG